MKILLIILLIVFLFTSFTFSEILNVPSVKYPTIQAGIDSSVNGDTVLVQPGTYIENINFKGKRIVVGSMFIMSGDTSFISKTVIDGDSKNSVVRFESEEDSTSILNGFTIRNGMSDVGGGIYCAVSHPKLINLKMAEIIFFALLVMRVVLD